MMVDADDDFGELYADVEVPAVNAINCAPQFTQSYINLSHQQKIDRHSDYSSDDSLDEHHLRNNDAKLGGEERREKYLGICDVGNDVVGDGNESDSEEEDDDFVVVVNDEDFEGKTGDEEVRENMDVNVVSEVNLLGNGSGSGCGGEVIGDVAKLNGGNSQYKYIRRFVSASMGTHRATRLRRVDKQDIGCFQQGSSCGRFEQTYAGSTVLSLGDQGNGFWLPRYRTILDVDIDTLEQKPWTHSGADMTDYFNFGFDEDSWKTYCQSLDQLRHQSLTQTRNQGYGSLRSNLAGTTKKLDSEEFAERHSDASGQRRVSSQELYLATRLFNRQIGQAIHVEDSNTERQPSMDVKPPRICDPDVVIEIMMQEPEKPSDSLMEPDDKLEAKFEMLEKGCEQGKLAQEIHISGDLKANELRQFSAEENVCIPTPSSDLRRSHESATVSSGMLEKSCTQTERSNSESDTQNSGKVDTFSGGNERAPNILKDDANSDRDSTATNPCVAGLDLLSDDDHIQSSATSSYSGSEGLNGDDRCDLRKSQNSRRSSPDSVVDRSHVARVDYHRSRDSKRDHTERKETCHKHPSRVRSSTEECLKYSQRNFWRHSEMRSRKRVNNDYHIDIPKHMQAGGRSRLDHLDEEWWHASDFINEDLPSYREKDYPLKCYDRRAMENQFHAECKEDSYRQDHWGSRDDITFNMRRRWNEDEYFSERTRRIRGDMGSREWNLEEREFVFKEGKHLFRNEPHSMSKYFSSVDMDRQSKYREYHDDHLIKRSKHVPPVEYRHSDCPMTDRFADSPLNDWQKEYVDSEIEHLRHLKHFGREARTFDRGDGFFEHPSSDLTYPRFIREDHEYHNRQAFPSIHGYHDEQPVYAERWHYCSLSRDDADINQICHRYEKNSRYISDKKSRDVRKPIDNRDAYDREDTRTYLDQDDYFENRRHIFQSEGMDWQDDALLETNINNGICDEMLDSVNIIPRHKCHGAKHGRVSNDMIIQAQGMKDRHGVISAGGKFYDRRTSKVPTRAKHEHTGLQSRNPVELRNFRGKKSSGNVSKPGSALNNDARLHNGRFQKHPKGQLELDASFSEKATVNKALKVEQSPDKPSIMTHCDLEEGQIPTEDLQAKKFDSGCLSQKDSLKGQLTHGQKSVNHNGSCAYDEGRILATIAKMEKRRERFKEPLLVKKVGDSDPNPQVVKSVETVECKGQRPRRKRQWGVS